MSRPSVTRRTAIASAVAATLAAGIVPVTAADAAVPPAPRGWVESTIARMTLEEKVGQLFVQHLYGATADTPRQENVDLYGVATPREVIQKYHLGGAIYFAWTDSVNNPQQIAGLSNGLQNAALTSDAKVDIPLVVAIDQEGGLVTRIGPPATQFPGSMALGAGGSTDNARAAARITGEELKAMGVNFNYAPVADVNVNPLNPVIGVRAFGSDPGQVSDMVGAQVMGYQDDAGISAAAKHFPGHGDTDTDSHVAFPIINHTKEEWEELDAPPFREAVARGTDIIMTAHVNFPALDDSGDPATVSKPVITGLLREELGYKGVVVSDALRMEGARQKYGDEELAVRALEAGVDLLLMTESMDVSFNSIVDAVQSGRISKQELDDKLRRILSLKHKRGLVTDPYVDVAAVSSKVGTPENLAAAATITDATNTLIKNDDGVLPMAVGGKKVLVTGFGVSTTADLASELAERGAATTVRQTGTSPSAATIAATVAATEGQDAVVVLTNRAWTSTAQQRLVKQLLATGKPVVVVAVRDPYDIAHFTEAPTYLATYSYAPVSPPSLARVLTGEVAPTGKLPVTIPTAADPDVALYPLGHGLTY
ncbi:beta-N-acetylhexosaminidase [Knoellia sinensis KCTC 19936]|uniref:beta-N-acetylhexosaminidase n=1 Tax=Knoellia sinensis KCTC 19936 TaxID=1385520 RepID=A0A0A0IZR5_9MICO|nr:glycoside hydrolase family 3 protein [Knoellia sinensis]KGN30303.1 beta-N-acetylhexosaminidase [Knoellia sinensis KCTC 19936]